jgi:hypothetical protein
MESNFPKHCMEQSPSWQAYTLSAIQNISGFFHSLVYNRVYKTTWLVHILSQLNPVSAVPSCFFKAQYNFILPSTVGPPSGLFPTICCYTCGLRKVSWRHYSKSNFVKICSACVSVDDKHAAKFWGFSSRISSSRLQALQTCFVFVCVCLSVCAASYRATCVSRSRRNACVLLSPFMLSPLAPCSVFHVMCPLPADSLNSRHFQVVFGTNAGACPVLSVKQISAWLVLGWMQLAVVLRLTRYGLDGPRIESRCGEIFRTIQSSVQWVQCKAAGAWPLPPPHIGPKLKKE